MFGCKFLKKQLCILIMHLKCTILIIACVLFYSLLFFIAMALPIIKHKSSKYDATTLKAKS